MFRFCPDLAERLTEPDHARPVDLPTGAVRGKLGQWRAPVRPVPAAARTLQPPDIPVELEDSAAAGAVMQAVHVLCDEREIGFGGFELNQRSMSGIRLRFGNQGASPI